jgi:hypothetical protein
VSVKLVTPAASAASPSHPDHSRWVKERTLEVEARHAHVIGGSIRDAEDANARNLIRLDARKREDKPKPVKQAVDVGKREITHAQLKEAGVTKRRARVTKIAAYKCKNCGLCRRCKRELRVSEIMRRNRIGDASVSALANSLAVMVLAHGLRKMYRDGSVEFRFNELEGLHRNRALLAATELICERSSATMGAWR